MKNKFLLGLITVFFGIIFSIIIFNVSESSDNKNYYFNRNISDKQLLKFEREYKKIYNNSSSELYYTNNVIVETQYLGLVKLSEKTVHKSYNLSCTDFSFSMCYKYNFSVPETAILLYVGNQIIVYFNDSKLYKIDLKTGSKDLFINKSINLDISFMVSLNNNTYEFLFFGEIFSEGTYKTGFFILNFNSNSIIDSKLLCSNKNSYRTDLILMHSGIFQDIDSKTIAYVCDKTSKIFLFNKDGRFDLQFNTKDNTPTPKIIKYGKEFSYSRAGLRYTNAAIFNNNSKIFVISMASNYNNKIIIDQYSRLTLRYEQSFKLDYKHLSSQDIQSIYSEGDRIIFRLQSNYASFKFSRYN